MLNSRPLVPLSSDLDDLNVLTPSHFLLGRSITSIVEPDLTNLNENGLDNWQKITKIIQLIWKRWSVDYLNSLQQRNKWHFEKKNAKIGDMVIIKEDNLPSCQWSLGRINNIYPGKDSKVKDVEVKTTRDSCKVACPEKCFRKLAFQLAPGGLVPFQCFQRNRTLLRPACAEGASSPLCLHFVSMLVIHPRSGRTYRPQ
ncbi:DUF5641 domain-containing protein [Trichonephila clavipes]|nr:DUF5641 domain-containing protein [Trichonephila clavipes]